MDSLTQLQDWLDFIAERFYVSVGVLQRDAVALPEGQIAPDSVSLGFAKEIIHASRVLEAIIAQLPRTIPSPEEEAVQLKALETSNQEAGVQLTQRLEQAEQWLVSVRAALKEITDDRLQDLVQQQQQP